MSRDQHTTEQLDPAGGVPGPGNGAGLILAAGTRLRDGRYVLKRRLGHGGMASVWLAHDERLARPVAIKALSDTLAGDAEYMSRFDREARTAARLTHPNLVNVYDYDATGPRPFLVMEYIEGGDLAARLTAGEPPEPRRLAAELLAALRHIHATGVLHRDVKPHNVLIDADGRARLTDFGIAQPRDATALTRTGQVIGTELYLAPEVAAGDSASERSDLFSLGVVLAEAVEAGGGADAGLWALIERLRAPEPGDRPGSAAAGLAALERIPAAGEPRLPPTAPAPVLEQAKTREPTPPRRMPVAAPAGERPRRAGVIALVALGAAIVAAVAIAAIGGDGEQPSGEQASAESGTGDAGGEERAQQPSGSGGDEAGEEPAPAESDGRTLNDEGFSLVQAGRYEEAVPILQRAVDALAASGDEPYYNYALYNLALAHLGAGQPEEAIPLLEERMQFDDGQLDEVQATLDEALAAAGESSGGTEAEEDKPEKPEKPDDEGPGRGDGEGPPPHAESESGGTEADG